MWCRYYQWGRAARAGATTGVVLVVCVLPIESSLRALCDMLSRVGTAIRVVLVV